MSNLPPEQQKDWRYQEIKYNPIYFQITLGLIFIIVVVLVGFALFPEDMGYRSNLYTTAVGILITVSVLDLLNRQREEKYKEREHKARLKRELRSQLNIIARRAAEELTEHGWHKDGTMRHSDLSKGNMQLVRLTGGDFRGSYFVDTDLYLATLDKCNLQCCNFTMARLSEALFINASLKSTVLRMANLRKAHFESADLRACDLTGANLENAVFHMTKFDETTILPDGSFWSQNEDRALKRFTRPSHPNFWRSEDALSPAYDWDKEKSSD